MVQYCTTFRYQTVMSTMSVLRLMYDLCMIRSSHAIDRAAHRGYARDVANVRFAPFGWVEAVCYQLSGMCASSHYEVIRACLYLVS